MVEEGKEGKNYFDTGTCIFQRAVIVEVSALVNVLTADQADTLALAQMSSVWHY